MMLTEQLRDLKTQNFKDKAADQREKINNLKQTDDLLEEASKAIQEPEAQVVAPVAKAESVHSAAPPKPKSKKASKPAWATTEKQAEEQKEEEIDDLLEFAYELDYEQYMEDFEVRQALAVIKERVNEIKQKPDWKEKMADEWNQNQPAAKDVDARSNATHNSYSKFSFNLIVQTLLQLVSQRQATQREWLRPKRQIQRANGITAP